MVMRCARRLLMASALILLGCVLCCSTDASQTENKFHSRWLAHTFQSHPNGHSGNMHIFREDSPGLLSHGDVVRGRRAPSTASHNVIFIVKQRNMDKLTEILHDVSDPRSQNYGNHLTRDEVINLTSNPESHDEIIAYLKAAGATVTLVEHAGGSITASASISVWERMLNTKFYSYSLPSSAVENDIRDARNAEDMYAFVRTEEYSVPLALNQHVDYVMNTVQLPQLRSSNLPAIRVIAEDQSLKSSRFSKESVIYQNYVTPQLLSNFYGIDDNSGHPRATQCAYETVNQLFSPQDLTSFQTILQLPIKPVIASYGNMTATAAYCKAHGYNICAEGNLDIMYLMGIADTPTIHWYSDKRMAWYLFALLYAPEPPPLVISMSYGSEERYLSESEFTTFEESAKKLGVMGTTILVSSGDDGVSPHPARRDPSKCEYMPTWPASCPYVISVGATQGIEKGLPETVCQNDRDGGITSGGGISTIYPMPFWQKDHMDRYFNQVNGTAKEPYPGFAIGGKGYPDVTAAGFNYIFIVGGEMLGAGGTSVSTPAVAGMISLVNVARLRAGGKPLGWITSLLYDYSTSFMNDITFGDNHCTALPVCCKQGFYAASGWDPASGLGSIDFKRFKAFMMSISNQSAKPSSLPSSMPIAVSTSRPSSSPSAVPSSSPSASRSSSFPLLLPTSANIIITLPPSAVPTSTPSAVPSSRPTSSPSSVPSSAPSPAPTSAPSAVPTSAPSATPSSRPTSSPSAVPSSTPSATPSSRPTSSPSAAPSSTPSATPSSSPSAQPTPAPSVKPSSRPTSSPSAAPLSTPSTTPSSSPSAQPTSALSVKPSSRPTSSPSAAPTSTPSAAPLSTPSTTPSSSPSAQPTSAPSVKPSSRPTSSPSAQPTSTPSAAPSSSPSAASSSSPSAEPTSTPSATPSYRPSSLSSSSPTSSPSMKRTAMPKSRPSSFPTAAPVSKNVITSSRPNKPVRSFTRNPVAPRR